MKYRKLLVDDQDGLFTMLIQYKTFFGWKTIKVLEEEDLEYLDILADEILEVLNY